ncbi:MAG: glycoside hydrolase family 16 protein [Sphingobacteriales bacterium]|nr:MAG: glycoside hydrolase family 16 protein [Sphingobacteriales bacterium]
MLHSFILLISIFFNTIFKESEQNIPVKGYKLFWYDEFDGKQLDLTKWNHRGLGKRDEAYITQNASTLNGKGQLVIETYIKNDSVFTGMISTENIFKTTYGYFECRVKFKQKPGTLSGFWLQSPLINNPEGTPETDGAEIDIFEYIPNANTGSVSHTLHWGGYSAANHKVAGPVWGKLGKADNDFHTIGLEWTQNSYTTFVDGVVTYTGNQHISKMPEFIVLSLGVNALSAGPLNINSLPQQFIVDYVRVYKKE